MLPASKPAPMTTMTPKFLNAEHGRRKTEGGSYGAALAGGLLLSVFCLAPSARAQSAAELLRAARAAESKIEYSATQIVQRNGARETARLFRSGAKRRLEWLSPGVKAGDILVDDGQKVWLYHRADDSAFQTQSSRRGGPNLAADDWKVSAPIHQGGRTVRVLSRGNGRQITLDTRTKAIIGTRFGATSTTLQGIKFGNVPDAKFGFTPPEGAKVTRINGTLFNNPNQARRRASWLQMPAQLPDDYAFESAIASQSEVWLRYSNGKRRFSIFEQKSDAGEVKPQKVEGGWFWKSGGLRFLVTGAPSEAIGNLATSLK